jgi:hypothetical protein
MEVPARFLRFHRVWGDLLMNMVALQALKSPKYGVGFGAGFNPGQHHAAMTLGASWPFNGK